MNDNSNRYKRQLAIEAFGQEGQYRLGQSSVLVVGAGGLGSPVLYYLAAAGVGTLGIMDFDIVEESNLNRQILHGTSDIGLPKVESAAAALRELNPEIHIEAYNERLTEHSAPNIMRNYDLVIDAVDSFGTKFLINDACVSKSTPFVHGGAAGWRGQIYLYRPGFPCLRCLFPTVPKELEAPQGLGILGAAAGCIGTMQALLAIKQLIGYNENQKAQLISFDGLNMRYHHVDLKCSNNCPICQRSD